ncbi:hypothetical protein D9601_19365 [Sphingomonas sp. MA1305]|uniref:hypothetical protein n=1 Tax=Sphingomonas sp. MA1305 TaxID=2479204 RepID=UPI0018E05076|nr:hypothetical protein [Sphingomonas sp. MA1305]MBI0477498.1 hypothetical protein [Sphingomonas sp. MA1305]
MATRALSIIAHDATTPAASIALPRPINDNLASWTADPRAKLLLASCAAHPPHGEWKRERFGFSGREWFEYVGYRAEALDAIRNEHGQRALDLYHAEGDPAYAVFALHCQSSSVTDAIDAAAEAALAAKMEG